MRSDVVASAVAGLLWEASGPQATFAAGAVFSVLSMAMLVLRRTRD